MTASTNNKMYTFSLPTTTLPKFVERSGKEWVSAGQDNKWFNYLIELGNSSALHGAIIKSIIDQVKGQGVRVKEDKPDSKLESFINSVNTKDESLDDVLSKVIYDYILFGGFSVSTVWNRGKTNFLLYHTDFSTLRSGKIDVTGNVDQYMFSSNWFKQSPEITQYPVFDESNKSGTQIYYYKPYSPGCLYYPIPEYVGVIPWAEIDAKVAEFHNANLDNGFFPSLFINYANGVPSPDRQKQIYEELMEDFQSSAKAGKILLNFSNGKETGAEVTPLNSNDSDKKFTDLTNLVLQQILSGWRIVSPELVGIKTPGQLGNGNLIESSELFFNTCIRNKQKTIEDEINYLLKANGFTGEIEIIPSQPVSFSLSEPTMLKVCTVNEIRELIGKEPIEGQDNIIGSGNTPTPTDQPLNTEPNADQNITD